MDSLYMMDFEHAGWRKAKARGGRRCRREAGEGEGEGKRQRQGTRQRQREEVNGVGGG